MYRNTLPYYRINLPLSILLERPQILIRTPYELVKFLYDCNRQRGFVLAKSPTCYIKHAKILINRYGIDRVVLAVEKAKKIARHAFTFKFAENLLVTV